MQAAMAINSLNRSHPSLIPTRAEAGRSEVGRAETGRAEVDVTGKAGCGDCVLGKLCLPRIFTSQSPDSARGHLNSLVRQNKAMLRRKDVLFHQGHEFDSLFVVRAGAIKTVMLDENGTEHITGFHLPGDIVGLDGISTSRYATTAVALDSTSVCTLPFAALEKVASQVPDVQHYVFRIMAQEIQKDQNMMLTLGHRSADQRMAAFLLRLSQHFQHRHLSADSFRLPMSRGDIGNFLGLAVETVCRILTRFQKINLLQTDGRTVSQLDIAGLQTLLSTPAREL